MNHPLQITFRHMDTSPAVETRVRQEVEALERVYGRITSCRVVVEEPHRRHQRGNHFHINIDLHVPGSHIVVNHTSASQTFGSGAPTADEESHQATAAAATSTTASQPHVQPMSELKPEHKDIYVCIRDAFAAARRQLDDYGQIRRHETKRHANEPADLAAFTTT